MGHKVGDKVYFWKASGDMRQAVIEAVDTLGCVSLEREDDWVDEVDAFATVEEAAKSLSPAGRRLEGCFREALSIYEGEEVPKTVGQKEVYTMVMKMAVLLFNAGNE